MQSHREAEQQDGFEEIVVIPSIVRVEAVRKLALSETGEVGKSHIDHGGLHLAGLYPLMDEGTSRELVLVLV